MQKLLRLLGDAPIRPLRATLLRRAMGLFGLLLVAATWPLWTPQTVFPQVPLIRAAGNLPAWFEWSGTATMLVGLFGMLLVPRGRLATASLATFAAGTAAMVLLDQQRLQPWAYQFMLLALVLALAERNLAFALLRVLIVSFYFYSAVTKLDSTFLHTLGQQFLAALVGTCGISIEGWSSPVRLAGAAVFPLGELLVAGGLLLVPTRKIGLAGAVILHLLLLVILGPLGLDHKPGVLLWNVFFIVQDLLLFWPTRSPEPVAEAGEVPAGRTSWLGCALVAAAIVLPFLEPVGWFDMWPSWGLYAASAERVSLEVHRRELDRWPNEWRTYLEEPADPDNPWLSVRLDRWSLDALGAPVYPQSRVQLGQAAGVVTRLGLGHRARAVRFGQADRFTGQRQYDVFRSQPQLEAALDEYMLNARPRSNLD